MKYRGFKIKVRCINWEQVSTIGDFWFALAKNIGYKNVVGLGTNWTDEHFDYAIGVIDDDQVLQKLRARAIKQKTFNPEYFELDLPEEKWSTFKGKDKDVQKIYENDVDCLNKKYDYELEYRDKTNIEIKVHYLDD